MAQVRVDSTCSGDSFGQFTSVGVTAKKELFKKVKKAKDISGIAVINFDEQGELLAAVNDENKKKNGGIYFCVRDRSDPKFKVVSQAFLDNGVFRLASEAHDKPDEYDFEGISGFRIGTTGYAMFFVVGSHSGTRQNTDLDSMTKKYIKNTLKEYVDRQEPKPKRKDLLQKPAILDELFNRNSNHLDTEAMLNKVDTEPARSVFGWMTVNLHQGSVTLVDAGTGTWKDGLNKFLLAQSPVRRFFQLNGDCIIPSKENGVDIEGIAATQVNEEIVDVAIGFRGPVLRNSRSPVLRLRLCYATLASCSNIEVPAGRGLVIAPEWVYTDFNGYGIRDFTPHYGGYAVLAGPIGDGNRPCEIWWWDGKTRLPSWKGGKIDTKLEESLSEDEMIEELSKRMQKCCYKPSPNGIVHLGTVITPHGWKAEGLAVIGSQVFLAFDGTKRDKWVWVGEASKRFLQPRSRL